MNPDNLNEPSLADAAGTTAADGGAAVDSSTLTLTELNAFLGKNFPDKDAALKALKDTQSFVGRRAEDIEREVRAKLPTDNATASSPDLAKEVSSLKEQVFYSQNPQYKGYESLIRKLGANPAEVVASDDFKAVFEKAQVADEVNKTRSVVASSPRVGQPTNATDDAVKVANATGSTERTAEALAQAIRGEIEGES